MTAWELLSEGARAYGATLSADQVSAFRRYYDLLVEWNRRFNLTRITGERDAVLKHFLDSLAYLVGVPTAWHDRPIRLLDVGAGAGFPGIPLLIARPKWTGELLEATRKKVTFLDEAVLELNLASRAQTRWGRAEEVTESGKARYDLVTARAVADVTKLVEWTLQYLRPGGRLLVSKGPKGRDEAQQAGPASRKAGGKAPELIALELPEGAGTRVLVVVEKR